MKALKDLTKDELLSFIYNHPPGDVNIFDPLAGCFVCGQDQTLYGYQCQKCQELDETNKVNYNNIIIWIAVSWYVMTITLILCLVLK